MKQLAEWTFEGVPDAGIWRQGATETASVIFAAYMLVYERVDFTSIMGGTAENMPSSLLVDGGFLFVNFQNLKGELK